MVFVESIPEPIMTNGEKTIKLAHPDGFYIAQHPKGADVFLGFATTSGQISTMNEVRGSTFMQAIAEHLSNEYEKMNLEEIYLAVTKIVAEEFYQVTYEPGKVNDFMQIPEKISTLREKVYFIKNVEVSL